MTKLVDVGATDAATLAALYFTDDLAGFQAGIRAYTGDLVSLDTVFWKADNDRAYATIGYILELHGNPEAPWSGTPHNCQDEFS